MGQKTEEFFVGLTADQIAQERPGTWGDFELLDVWDYFIEQTDRERETAVLELMLHSPENGEMVDYEEPYLDLVGLYRIAGEHEKAIAWLYAAIAYDEQHEPTSRSRLLWRNSLAEAYLYANEFNAGLALISQNLHSQPGNLDTYNLAAYALAEVDLSGLALELLARAFAVAAIVQDEEYNSQWEDLRSETEAEVEADKEEGLLSEVTADVLSGFRAALTLPVAADFDKEASLPLVSPIDKLATADSLTPALTDDILAQHQLLTPDLIRLAYGDPATPGPTQAIALLRRLRDEQTAVFAELSSWLDRADEGWQQTLTQSIGKIGGFTIEELQTIAADTSYYQFTRTSATEALRERLEQSPELHEQIVTFFRHLLNRPEAQDLATEEEFIAFLIADALGADLRELYPDIKRAFLEDRVDPSIVSLRSVEEEWALPFSQPPREIHPADGMNLQLECTNCGRKRFHFTRHVLVDTLTLDKQRQGQPVDFDAHVLDHEIICPKCGAADQYRLTPQAQIVMLGQQSPEGLLALFAGNQAAQIKPNPRVHRVASHALGGPMHPLKALQRYQHLIATQPRNVDFHMRLGTLFLFVMRHEPGLAALRHAYELAPDKTEIIIRLAMAEHDFGDRAQAEALYQQVFQLTRQDIFSSEMVEVAKVARDGLKALKSGAYSPMDMPISASDYYGEPEKQKKGSSGRRGNKQQKPKKRRR